MRAARRLWHAASVGERQSLLARRRSSARHPPPLTADESGFHSTGDCRNGAASGACHSATSGNRFPRPVLPTFAVQTAERGKAGPER
jgi:hypothetical protein